MKLHRQEQNKPLVAGLAPYHFFRTALLAVFGRGKRFVPAATRNATVYGKSGTGFTLLIAVLVIGVVLSIGLAILNLTVKEFTLSNIVRESQIAFSAADAGIECAFYWDGLPRDSFNVGAVPSTPSCGGASVTEYGGGSNALIGGNPYGVANEFELRWGNPEVCARVEVTKHDSGTLPACPAGVTCTVVVSRGYNTCDVDHPRTVERALRARY